MLATAIIGVTAALVGAVLVRQLRAPAPASVGQPSSPEIDMALNKLHFSEMRGNEQLWELVAERAEYDKDSGRARLAGVRADIHGGRAGGMLITAETGSYDEAARLVQLRTRVHAVSKRGMVFDTDQLDYLTAPGRLQTAQPVTVRDGRLTLQAVGMEMSLHDEKVRFSGPVEAVIEGYRVKN